MPDALQTRQRGSGVDRPLLQGMDPSAFAWMPPRGWTSRTARRTLRGGALREFRVRLDPNRRQDLRPRRGAQQGRYPKAHSRRRPDSSAPHMVTRRCRSLRRSRGTAVVSWSGPEHKVPSRCPGAEARSREARRGTRGFANRRRHRAPREGLRRHECSPPRDLLSFSNPETRSITGQDGILRGGFNRSVQETRRASLMVSYIRASCVGGC